MIQRNRKYKLNKPAGVGLLSAYLPNLSSAGLPGKATYTLGVGWVDGGDGSGDHQRVLPASQLCAPTPGRHCLLSMPHQDSHRGYRALLLSFGGRTGPNTFQVGVLCGVGQNFYLRKTQRRSAGRRGVQLTRSFPGFSFPLPATRTNRMRV